MAEEAQGRGDRPGEAGGAREDDYDWLYGGARGPSAGSAPPGSGDERTRAIPTSPREPEATQRIRPHDAPPTTIAPTPGSSRGAGAPPRPARTSRSRRRPLRWVLLVLLAWVAYLVVVPVYAWNTVSKVDADPSGPRPGDQPGTTYLVVGSDARAGLAGQRTDTIMLLHTGAGPDLLLSIPRDSIVEVPGQGTTKINAAFAIGGPRLLVRTIEAETGIRVDDYVEIGFTGFVGLVDAVGGVEICPEKAMRDPQAELDIRAGCQEADGATALGYARSRKTQALGDIDRARHQREVVTAIGREIVSWRTVVNPVRYWKVAFGGADSVRVSEGTGPLAAGRFAYAMTRVNGTDGLTCGVPIASLEVQWDSERADQLFRLIAEDRTQDVGSSLCTPSGMPRS